MKRTQKIFCFASLIIISLLLFYGCKRKSFDEGSKTTKTKLTLEDAKSHYKELEIKYGDFDTLTINGTLQKNYKKVDFAQAYIGENKTCYFIEVPITYTLRKTMFVPSSAVKPMHRSSFTKLVIYKDKNSGMVSEKIVTFIPSVEYNDKYKANLYNNHYQSVDENFSGFVTATNWKGKFLSAQTYNSGKAVAQNKIASLTASTSKVMSRDNCEQQTFTRVECWCEDFDENGNPVNCDCNFIPYQLTVCEMTTPSPKPTSPYHEGVDPSDWNGFPEPNQPGETSPCWYFPRPVESPILTAYLLDSLYISYYSTCVCPGYSWIIFEDKTTGVEYSYPQPTPRYPIPGCTAPAEVVLPNPPDLPAGTYFLKVWLDGDVFYHQYEQDGVIQWRYTHTKS